MGLDNNIDLAHDRKIDHDLDCNPDLDIIHDNDMDHDVKVELMSSAVCIWGQRRGIDT